MKPEERGKGKKRREREIKLIPSLPLHRPKFAAVLRSKHPMILSHKPKRNRQK